MAIRQAAKRRLTLEEFLALPETEPASELIDGEVVQKPVAKIEHNMPVRFLIRVFESHPRGRSGIWITEQGVNFPSAALGNHRVPDCLVCADVPMPRRGYPDIAPALAVEVRSEGQSARFLREKLQFLRDQGTRCTLLVDPYNETVEHVENEVNEVLRGDDHVVLACVGGLGFRVGDIFQ